MEKPQIPKSNMALVGIYKIKESNMFFECLENNINQELRTHGEYSITDALDCMIKKGAILKPLKLIAGLIAARGKHCWNPMLRY